MRSPTLLLFLWSLTAAAQTSPQKLAGAHFYPSELVLKVRAQQPLPEELHEAPPRSVFFPAPGEVEFFDGERRYRCSFTATGSGYLWALQLDCGGITVERHWTWMRSGAVATNLVEVPDGELMRLDGTFERPPPPAPVLKEPVEEPALPPPTFSSLAGTWQDSSDNALTLRADGTLTLLGRTLSPELSVCAHIQVEPHMAVPCLRFQDEGGRDIAFALLGNFAWVEGVVRPAPSGEGLHYEGWREGRMYRRVPVPTPAPQAQTH